MPVSPNRAITPEQLSSPEWQQQRWIVQEKYDGSLYLCRITSEGLSFTSRRLSVKDGKPVDKTANLPHFAPKTRDFTRFLKLMDGTLVLGEILAPSHSFKDTMAVMGSSAEKAIARQEQNGWLQYLIFDCVFFRGQDLCSWSLANRMSHADIVMRTWWPYLRRGLADCLQIAPYKGAAHPDAYYRQIVAQGGEGVMMKDLTAPYGRGVVKCKKVQDVSVVLTGFTEGAGKYAGQIGAALFSVYCGKDLVEVGQCSGMTDSVRQDMTAKPVSYLMQVMDVTCQPPDNPAEFQAGKHRLRHPRFVRMRRDLSPRQCTEKKLKDDFTRQIA